MFWLLLKSPATLVWYYICFMAIYCSPILQWGSMLYNNIENTFLGCDFVFLGYDILCGLIIDWNVF